MTIAIGGRIIRCCGECPRNKTVENKLWGFIPMPDSHHCSASLNAVYPEGNLILNPNSIPKWCPHVIE